MEKFTILIEETVVDKFEVEASDADEAMKIAKKKYHDGELVLELGEVQFKQMAVCQSDNENVKWIEF